MPHTLVYQMNSSLGPPPPRTHTGALPWGGLQYRRELFLLLWVSAVVGRNRMTWDSRSVTVTYKVRPVKMTWVRPVTQWQVWYVQGWNTRSQHSKGQYSIDDTKVLLHLFISKPTDLNFPVNTVVKALSRDRASGHHKGWLWSNTTSHDLTNNQFLPSFYWQPAIAVKDRKKISSLVWDVLNNVFNDRLITDWCVNEFLQAQLPVLREAPLRATLMSSS